jgi:D-beta-D-heptose 7-phosphate kinase/D-beta-D-heptose 1-phosphate adenosyltransferase
LGLSPEETLRFRGLARDVFDVTGAGDAVAAMLAIALAEAARRANLAGSLAVTKAGTQPVFREEFERLLTSHRIGTKILTWEQARSWVEVRRRRGHTVVFTNGCFDILHAGHVWCLEEARRQGDCLIVGLNSDHSVRALKGSRRPVISEHYRAQMLAALECVDAVVIFEEETPARLIDLLRPQVMVKGGDYRPEEIAGVDRVLADGGRVVIVPLFQGLSTTQILRSAADLQQTHAEP